MRVRPAARATAGSSSRTLAVARISPDPSTTTRRSSTVTRSATRRTCSRSCDTIRTVVRPVRFAASSISSRMPTADSSRPAVGSSRSSSSGSGSSACASSTRRSSPPESTDERAPLEARQADARPAAARCVRRVGAREAEADRPPLPRQRQKIGDRDRQGRIDGEALRHVADRARCRVQFIDDPSVERDLARGRPRAACSCRRRWARR